MGAILTPPPVVKNPPGGFRTTSLDSVITLKLGALDHEPGMLGSSPGHLEWDFSDFVNVTDMDCESANFTILKLPPNLEKLESAADFAHSGVLDVSGMTKLAYIELNNAVNLTGMPGLADTVCNHLELVATALDQPAVDEILAGLVAGGIENGYCDLRQTVQPSAEGLLDVATLEDGGWTMFVDEE